MKTQRKIRVAVLLTLLMGLSGGLQAAVVTFQDEQPVPGPYDIYNFIGADRDANNIGTYDYDTWLNNETTYIAGDRPAQGQTFVTDTDRPVYLLTGVWIRHVGYTNSTTTGTTNNGTWYFLHVGNSFGVRVTDPCAAGTASFVLASEAYTLTGNEPNALHPFSENYNHGNANGSGKWIHLVLDTPVILEPGTTYGYDVVSVKQEGGWGANMFFESLGIKDDSRDPNGTPNGNPYLQGKAYTSGTGGVPADTLTWVAGDRVFMAELSGEVPVAAYGPTPTNRSWCTPYQVLTWQPGKDAALHDVYFDADPGKVSDATRTAPLGVLKSTGQSDTTFDPGTLDEGVTYYWRIDEVQGSTITKGNVWRFFVQPSKAFNPAPFNHEICVSVSPSPILSWSSGADATQGKVYFGTTATSQSLKRVAPYVLGQTGYTYETTGSILNDKDYYWRIDEKQPDGTFKTGDVWHFTTIPSTFTQPDAHLVGWWKFDEGPGKAIDWSGKNQHGTVYHGATTEAGTDGDAIKFDGSDDYVNLPIGQTLSGLNSMTVTTWVSVLGDEASQKIFDFGMDPAPGPDAPTLYMYLTPINGSGVPRFAITTTGTGGESGLDAPSALSSGWHHVAVTLDGNSRVMELFIDGSVVVTGTTQTLPRDLGMTTDNYLGQSKRWENSVGVPDPHFRGSLDDFRLYDKVLTQQELAKAMSGNPLLAWNPSPANGILTDSQKAVPLNWSAGDGADQHDVYLGVDAEAVGLATSSDTTGIYRGRQTPTTYTPSESLQWDQTYSWRIDEVQSNGTVSKGRVWTFSVAEYLIVDNFEGYNDLCNRIYYIWVDGYGITTALECGAVTITGNGSGSTVGNDQAPYAEQTMVHSGNQSMPFRFDNTAGASVSEAIRTFDAAQDWTASGVKTLVLFFQGEADNGAGQLYIKINDTQVLYPGSADVMTKPLWKQWNIELASVGASLTSVKSLTVGVSGSVKGKLYIDDILLYREAPAVLAPVDPGTAGLSAYYTMDGDAKDSSGKGHNGTLVNDPVFGDALTGFGQALQLDGVNQHVELPIGTLVSTLTSATVATWVNFDTTSTGSWVRIFDFGTDPNRYMFLTPRQGTNGTLRWAIRTSATTAESNVSSTVTLPSGWHHVAVVIDSPTMTVQIYLDGDGVASGPITALPADLGTTTQNWLGRSQFTADGYFAGALDEFRIYNRALSAGEVRYLAGDR